MLSIAPNLLSPVAQSPNVPAYAPPVAENFAQNIKQVNNIDTPCITIAHKGKAYDPIAHGRGRKLESIKTSFANNIKSLRKYNISINTEYYNKVGPSGRNETQKALDEGFISFVSGDWVNKKDNNVLLFTLPKDIGDYRVELAHRNQLGMSTDSSYDFEMRVGYSAHSAIFFQVKEVGGDMISKGGGRPPISLHVKDQKEIFIAINSDKGNVLRKKIAVLDCPQEWYKFKVRIVWDRAYPRIQVGINGTSVFQSNVGFGAHNSKGHYSKFGIYIPQQKTVAGTGPTSFLFDNVRESHRQFSAPAKGHKN